MARLLGVAVLSGVVFWSLLAKEIGPEIPFESDGGTVISDPAVCANQFCHSTFMDSTLNTLGQVEFSNLPTQYIPGRSYDLKVVITGRQFVIGPRIFGFQLASIFSDHTQAGSLLPGTAEVTTVLAGGVEFLTHREPLPSGEVDFQWTAPAAGQGPVLLRIAANAAYHNGMESGDAISTSQSSIPEGEQVDPELDVFYFPQIGVGTSGDSTFNTDLVFVNTGPAGPLQIEVFQSNGEAMQVSLESSQGDSILADSLQTQLDRGASLDVRLRGLGPISAGYVRVTAGSDVSGVAIFSFQVESGNGAGPQTLYDSGVPIARPLREFSLAVKVVAAASDTGLALVHPIVEAGQSPASAESARLTLTLYDQEFTQLSVKELVLQPGQQVASFVSELFPVLAEPQTDFSGSVTVQGDRSVAAVTLRQTTIPTLTAFPVIPGRADGEQ